MNEEVDQLLTKIIREKWESEPVSATFLGIHDFDDRLGKYDKDTQTELIEKAKNYVIQLKTYQGEPTLSGGQKIDLQLLIGQLESEVRFFETVGMPFRNATIYPYICLYGIYSLLIREFAPLEQRMKDVLSRLGDVPRILKEGQQNLSEGENIPRVWTEIAFEVTEAGIKFFQTNIKQLSQQVSDIREQIERANNSAIQALKEYQLFLKQQILSKAVEDFAIGDETFNFLLKNDHLLPYDVDSLITLGRECIAQTEQLMEQIAGEINKTRSWREIVAALKEDYPSKDELTRFYQERMEAAKEFVRKRDLVTIPANEILRVEETPIFERPTTPYAAYLSPPPFDTKPEGIFWVTPIDMDAPPERQSDQLRGHNRRGVTVVALHEAYPGHHLQLSRANELTSPVRKHYHSTVFVEGWALYCEEMMFEMGFYPDRETRLLQLKDQLWRSCRVVIDASIHSRRMSFEDAVKMLVEVADVEGTNAQAEVKRYTISPTQPMSYIVGKKQILELREEVRNLKGKDFRLKYFHDRLLSFGSIPLSLIAPAMLSKIKGE